MGKGSLGVMSRLLVPTIKASPGCGKLSECEQEKESTARNPEIISTPARDLNFIMEVFIFIILNRKTVDCATTIKAYVGGSSKGDRF
jgi:hypothetical protein